MVKEITCVLSCMLYLFVTSYGLLPQVRKFHRFFKFHVTLLGGFTCCPFIICCQGVFIRVFCRIRSLRFLEILVPMTLLRPFSEGGLSFNQDLGGTGWFITGSNYSRLKEGFPHTFFVAPCFEICRQSFLLGV